MYDTGVCLLIVLSLNFQLIFNLNGILAHACVQSESTDDLWIILRGMLINSVVSLCHCDPHHKFDVKRFKASLDAAKTEGKAFLS